MERSTLDENGNFKTVLNFKRTVDEDSFIVEEKRRWCDGYGNLTGRHYFHLTMGNMLDSEEGRIRPQWRDADSLAFDGFDECSKGIIDHNGDIQVFDLAFFKRKEWGFSSVFMACMPIYNCVMYPNQTNLLTSCDVNRTEEIRNNKVYPYLETTQQLMLNPGVRPIDNKGVMRFIRRGGTDKVGSQIVLVETGKDPDSPTKVAGFRAIYGCVDEMLLHPRASAVQNIIKGSLKTGTDRTRLKNYRGEYDGHHAMFVMGGSCDSVDKSAVQKAHVIIKEAKAKYTKIVFIPAWMCNKKYMINGFSQKDKACEAIYRVRKHLSDNEAYEELNLEIRRSPIYLSEIFDAANKLSFGSTIPFKLKESRLAIMNSTIESVTQCDLRRNGTNIELYPNKEGYYFIRKMPVKGHVYIGAVDSLPFNTENMNEKMSKFCCLIKDITTNEDVAYFMMRDPDPEVIAPLWEKICVMYASDKTFTGGAPCMVERNRDVIIHWCKRNHKTHLLLRDPLNHKEYGVFSTDKLIETMNECMLSYIRLNGLNFIEMINDFENKSNMKSDLLDAKKILEYAHTELFKKPAKGLNKVNMMPKRVLKRDEMGKSYWDYKEEYDE